MGLLCAASEEGHASPVGVVVSHVTVLVDLIEEMQPWGSPEERLYPLVSEALAAWARVTRPRVEILRIVGDRWAPRCHELRDLSERNGIPYGWVIRKAHRCSSAC